jgi:Fe-S oxidoreductase
MADDINRGKDPVGAADLHDIASLFKQWFRDLTDPVVPKRMLEELSEVWNTKNYAGFCDKLPRAHRAALMYLVGFLQRLTKSQAVTMMGPKNFAICFAPNLVQVDGEEAVVKKYTEIAIEMITTRIEEWDVSEIYPPRPEWLTA